MFKIALKSAQYQTYVLSDENALSEIEIVPERGGIITRWRIQGQEILYLDEERFRDPDLSVRGGIPILFPICGNLPDNTYVYQNKTYSLKQHGFARDLPWQVADQKIDECACLSLILNSNDQTKAVYPFDFQLIFTYTLQGNRLSLQQRYINLSDEVMPFSSGLHPYFWVENADKPQLSFEIPSSQYQDQRTQAISPFTASFDFDASEIDVAFKPITGHTASFFDKSRKIKLNLHYSDAYSTLVFWTLKEKDYICLEPWTAGRNALNTGENLLYLDPHTHLDTLVTLLVN